MARRDNSARRRRQQLRRNSSQPAPAEQNAPSIPQPTVLLSAPQYCNLLLLQGRYQEALEVVRRDLPPANQPIDFNALCIFSAMATVYMHMRRYDMALVYFRRAMNGLEHLVGEAHPITVEMTMNVAVAYAAVGQYQNAEVLYRRAEARMVRCIELVRDIQVRQQEAGRNTGAVGGWWVLLVVLACVVCAAGVAWRVSF